MKPEDRDDHKSNHKFKIFFRLRAHCTDLEEECEDTKKTLQKLDEDRADIIAFLKRTLQSKSDEIVELQERLTALQQVKTN